DIFDKAPSAETLRYIEAMRKTPGAHVVLLTSRPFGELDLGNKLFDMKSRRTNPIYVVSNNGGTISKFGQKEPLDEMGAFSKQELAQVQAADTHIRRTLGLAGKAANASPGDGNVYRYTWVLPKDVSGGEAASMLLKAKGMFEQHLAGTGFVVAPSL